MWIFFFKFSGIIRYPYHFNEVDSVFLCFYVDGVDNITIQPNPDNAPGGILEMSVGEFINCSADGRPEPTYNWTCDDGQVIPGIPFWVSVFNI